MNADQPLNILLPIIRRVIPNTIAQEITGVQPMSSIGITHICMDENGDVYISDKVGEIYAKSMGENIDAKYSAAKVEYTENVIHNGGLSGFSGQIFAMRTKYSSLKK
jgi:hypothetical protein